MHDTLKKLKDENKLADFLFPALPDNIKGKVVFLSADMVAIDSDMNGETFQYICHPNNICIVQKKT